MNINLYGPINLTEYYKRYSDKFIFNKVLFDFHKRFNSYERQYFHTSPNKRVAVVQTKATNQGLFKCKYPFYAGLQTIPVLRIHKTSLGNENIGIYLDYRILRQYKIEEILELEPTFIGLDSSIDSIRSNARLELIGTLVDKGFPLNKIWIFDLWNGIEELETLLEVFNIAELVTNYPIRIGLAGRELGEDRPQLPPMQPIMEPINKEWLTYIIQKFIRTYGNKNTG